MDWTKSQQSGDRRTPPSVLARVMVSFAAFLCVIPAVLLNASAQVSMGTDSFVLVGFVALGFAAPFFSVCAGKALREKAVWGFGLYAALAFFFAGVNTIIALGAISAHQDTRRDARASMMREASVLQDTQDTLKREQDTLRAVAGYDAPDMIEQRLIGLRTNPVFKRSGECKDVTRTDSYDFCDQITKEGAKLAAAKRLVEIRIEMKAGWQGREEAAPTPEVRDPWIANLGVWARMLNMRTIEDRVMAAGIAGILAIALELLADFGPPAVIWFWWPKARPEERVVVEPEEADPVATILKPEPKSAKPARPQKLLPAPEKAKKKPVDILAKAEKRHVAEWLAQSLSRVEGQETQAKYLHESCIAWCRARNLEAPTLNTFGATLKDLGMEKVKRGGLIYYQGVQLASALPTLKVVAVS